MFLSKKIETYKQVYFVTYECPLHGDIHTLQYFILNKIQCFICKTELSLKCYYNVTNMIPKKFLESEKYKC